MSKLKTISKLDGLDGRLEGATRPRQIIWQTFGLHISCNVPDRPLRGCRSMQPRSTKGNSEHPAFSIDNAPAPWPAFSRGFIHLSRVGLADDACQEACCFHSIFDRQPINFDFKVLRKKLQDEHRPVFYMAGHHSLAQVRR